MKRKISFTVIILMLSLLLFGLTACGEKEAPGENESASISFKTLTVNGNNVYGKVSNDTTYYSFIDEISTVGGADYIVSKNATGTDWLPAKSVDLVEGDNTVYIIEMVNDEPATIYTVVIRRRPVYTVTFDTNGGSTVKTQYIEEECFATVPEATTYAGYTFTGWDYDFSAPIMSDTNITASWEANTALNDFYFTSTITTCEITGIKNENATDIVIPDCVTSIGSYAFRYCSRLTSVTIGNSVKSIGDEAFQGCTSLTSVTIPDSVTSIGELAFYNCYSLTSVTIPDSVTSIGDYAFYHCDKLVEVIDLSSLNITAGSNSYGYVGYYAKEVHNGESKIVNYNDYLFYTYSGVNYLLCYVGSDTDLDLPESYNGEAYEIYDYAFRYCTSLTSVTIGNSVTTIGDEAFLGCSSLMSVIIPDSVTSIGNLAFEYCSSLTSVTIPNSVTSIGEWAFGNCTSLMSVIIPDSVKSIGPWAFGNCSSLTIYCEAASQPSGWNSNWNVSNRPVVWGYKAEE